MGLAGNPENNTLALLLPLFYSYISDYTQRLFLKISRSMQNSVKIRFVNHKWNLRP
jgi:hypothetical protein